MSNDTECVVGTAAIERLQLRSDVALILGLLFGKILGMLFGSGGATAI